MSEVRLVVREEGRDWSGTVHGSCADRAVAALSADPATLEELELAAARFARPGQNGRIFTNLAQGRCAQPYDAGLVVIDLVARLVVIDSTYSSPGPDGFVSYHNGQCGTQTDLPYHLAGDWLFSCDSDRWEAVAEERRRERAARPPLDARGVFYGRPLLEFIGRETFSAFARRHEFVAALPLTASGQNSEIDAAGASHDRNPSDGPVYDTLKDIHAAWLLTPRDDLGGACPREVALDRRDHLSWDLQDRCNAWSSLHECPPGLAESSLAYRHGGFGTHELVEYYSLVRELLWSCWGRLTELAQSSGGGQLQESFSVGDFLTAEMPRLEGVREAWLDTPDPEFHGRTPRSIVARERARLPECMSGREAMIDPDCPCCQMMGDLPGPMFWHLDGSEMDDEFAFNMHCRTLEEWQEEQRRWDEYNKRFDAEWAERERLGVTSSAPREDGSTAMWSRSVSVGDAADVPLGIRVFGVGCRLAEVIVGLRAEHRRDTTPPATQSWIDRLNRDFGNLREVLQSPDESLAETLIDPVLDRFAETLDNVATARPDLAAKCESLTGELHGLLRPPPPEATYDPGDSELPF